MKREEFIVHLTDLVNDYINFYVGNDAEPQIRINPESLNAEFVDSSEELYDIDESDAVVEEAAAADDSAAEDADDFQSAQNPDYYAIHSLVKIDSDGSVRADAKAIEAVADIYFR